MAVLLFGIIEFGLLFRDELTASASARNGARAGSAMPREPGYEDRVLDRTAESLVAVNEEAYRHIVIYKADPDNGLPTGISSEDDVWSCTESCWKYQWDGNAWTRVGTTEWPAEGPDSQYACPPGPQPNQPGPDYLGVWVELEHAFITKNIVGSFFGGGDSQIITSRTVMRLEPISQTAEIACGEAP